MFGTLTGNDAMLAAQTVLCPLGIPTSAAVLCGCLFHAPHPEPLVPREEKIMKIMSFFSPLNGFTSA
jgi:hypothetical protein